MLDDALGAFLHFGYLPAGDDGTPWVLRQVLDARPASGAGGTADDEDGLTASGVRALRACFEAPGAGVHVVPLSGGLDSRAVLAGLVAAGVRDDVVAVTVGTPGTFDFDIARRVAERAGVRHEAIDLTGVSLDPDGLERALVESDAASWAFDVYFHRLIPTHFGHDATYWSGFLGGELAGSHVPGEAEPSWSSAVRHFVAHAAFCPGGGTARPGVPVDGVLPSQPWCAPETLSFPDQLDFGVRQDGYVARTVLVAGYDYRTPFLTPSWVDFILTVPLSLRRGERLFRRILTAAYPDLFAIPTKNTAGLRIDARPAAVTARFRLMKLAASWRSGSIGLDLRRRRLPPPFAMVNYLDFSAGLRSNPRLRALVRDLVHALDGRDVVDWVSGSRLWAAHEAAGHGPDMACALTLLASLELNLRADSARARPRFDQAR